MEIQQSLISDYSFLSRKKKFYIQETAPSYWSDIELLSILLGTEAAENLLNAVKRSLQPRCKGIRDSWNPASGPHNYR